MKMSLVAIKDKLISGYIGEIQAFPSDDVAVRVFGDMVQDAKSPMSRHPEDYELHRVGFFETETGELFDSRKVLVS